jgi:ABC-2 type transport system permease protein
MKRTFALAHRIFLQFLRDKRTLVLIFAVPIFIMGMLTWLLRVEAQPFRTSIISAEAESEMVRDILVNLLEEHANAEIVEGIEEHEIMKALEDGRIQGAIVMRGAGMDDLQAGERAGMEVYLEGSDPMTSAEFLRQLQRVQRPLLDAIRGLIFLAADDLALIEPPELTLNFLYGGEDFNESDYLAPPVICFVAFFFVFLLTAVSFLRERANGTMERLLAIPLTRLEIVSGYLLGFLVFTLAQTGVIFIFVLYILKIHYLGNLASILLVVLILVIGASNMGILFSSFAKNEFQVAQFIPLVILPQILVSGLLWSVETLPRALQYIAYALPLTYANMAMRKLMIKGFAIHEVLPELGFLIAFAALMIIGSIISMRRSIF